ncbi:MAG TPA: tetratricopeptide repeat protein [Blastocatellia bacterium]|nr:tetratricopeptide repeat protein [Blastocatellia bacterium]HMV85033.1 tetratricopeptide repeat protein [Blastocatellia bacterium]HMX26803.1 tetratricopeptide repeat protein [Blastocatellia bacterium]HMY72661.1 tetratricopeptide repeat protein [Blastocatellia bacterium]HMZ17878.1 tetratricopeptide repeat protein [Blastocatellia bacterium]
MKRFTICILLAFLLTCSGFAQQPADATATALAEARTLLNNGNPKGAIAKLTTLTPQNDPRVAQLLGVAYYNSNDHVHAVEHLSAAVGKLQKDSPAWRESVQLLGLSNFILGRLAEAIPFLEQTSAWLPNNNELTYALGMASVQTRQPAKARAAFGRMFHVAPDSAAAHLLTAQMMIRVEMEDFADAELKLALEKDQRLPQANYLLAQNAIYKNRFDEGIALLEKELTINPNNAMAYYKIGDALTRQLKWDEAISQLQKSVWLNPFYSGPYILLGKSYLKKKELSNAEGMLRRAIQFDPNNKSAHYILGQVYQQLGKAEDAKREFGIAEKLQGNQENPEK